MQKNVGPACPLNGSLCLAFYQPLPQQSFISPVYLKLCSFRLKYCVCTCVCAGVYKYAHVDVEARG